MIIDFHTHIFPEKIAAQAVSKLETLSDITAFSDGTLEGLKSSMLDAKIDLSVILPVVTKPSQFKSVNDYAASITGKDNIISFGGIHPDSLDYKNELQYIKALKLKGIKLHPDYQNTFIDDNKNLQIISNAVKLGLIVSIHSGVDIGLPLPVHCTPDRALKMLDFVCKDSSNQNPNIILAHTGGFKFWEETFELLAGENVFLDISYSLGYIPDDLFLAIVNKHGADKILFATDSPWGGQKETVARFLSIPLSDEQREFILWKNAAKLLNIEI